MQSGALVLHHMFRPYHVVVGAHRKNTRCGHVRPMVQLAAADVRVEDIFDAALGEDAVLAGLDVKTFINR